MLDFENELNMLLAKEAEPFYQSDLMNLALAERELLAALSRKQTDFSLQIEEIYDLVKDADTGIWQDALKTEQSRASQLLRTALGLCDILEDFCAYSQRSGSEELVRGGALLWKNSGLLLENCGITRIGEAGQTLDPTLHTVQAGVDSPLPREQLVSVLQSGYRYLGAVLRKAVVTVSKGNQPEHTANDDRDDTENEDIDNGNIDNEDIDNEAIDNDDTDNDDIDNDDTDNDGIENDDIDNEDIDNDDRDNNDRDNDDIENEEELYNE
ncbi:MAG: nucleotide exchange factor GrpE [Spirochaetaceae bacterium]|jgi:molecular chaperone GrpE (heat shock protein)|nr:nucleotide exchange factor GrpE [Spirochaetaceae bacterium]